MHFRMRRNTFQFLLELLRPKLCKQTERFGREPILPEKQLLIAIWMLATPNSYRCISDRFNVGKGTAWRCVHRVINALYAEVRTFIKWPTRQEAEQTMETIQNQYGFPGVIGAVDGTHVRIAAPQDHGESYVNRKGFHSIQLQVICDAQLRFIHCYTGQVGFVHDMRVFRLSNVESMFTEENFPHDSHILGDAAYRISKYVMVPFKDNSHLTERQINFNKCQSGARMIVERSLGLLKGRFRSILDTLPMRKTRVIPKYIMACCILHNICLLRNDMIDIPIIVDEPNIAQPVQLENNVEQRQGIDKRNAIMYNLLPNM
ncbi:putative nuclease HARBI1 [Temnothorax longispinosus]|uniref:putative nuclease HARBI1 n=1 Tax=Temnothorax longispinosus TaxID=300112 RepID=UPI003A9A56D3